MGRIIDKYQLAVLRVGLVQADAVSRVEKIVGLSVDQEDWGRAMRDSSQRTVAIDIKVADFVDARGDFLKVTLGEHPTRTAKQNWAGVGGGIAQ